MRSSRNLIGETWLAYALEAPWPRERVEVALGRVGSHYSALIADGVRLDSAVDEQGGLALWHRDDARLRWPLWAQTETKAMAATAVPTGWRRLTGTQSPDAAPARLAEALAADPDLGAELNPPFVVGVRDGREGSLTIVNDFLGAGRLYELEFAGGRVWSNRLGALPLFAGIAPEADEAGWAIFGAAGWFLGATTPLRGARKVAPGTVITAGGPAGAGVVERRTEATRRAVAPRRARLARSADAAAEQIVGMAEDLGSSWDSPVAISLTGGRDSRVSAAAALAAGIEATFNTGDQVPGEVDVVRDLVARAPRPMEHTVYEPEPDTEAPDGLAERVRAIHLVHDGMRNPQEIRRPTELPIAHWPRPTLSGHGGELGHGFYYATKQKLKRLDRGRERAITEQLERNARRRHSAAHEEAYALYLDECERTLAEGRAHGLDGPVLLDWFYMAQRLPYRSGLGARSGRSSACVAPAFVRGAFDLSPKDRLSAKLHREVVARLVPEWSKVPFFSSDSEEMPEIKRARIWERPREAAALEEIIASRSGWPQIFDPARIEAMWAEVRAGEGSADYEHVFYRLAWRAGYEDHLRELSRA